MAPSFDRHSGDRGTAVLQGPHRPIEASRHTSYTILHDGTTSAGATYFLPDALMTKSETRDPQRSARSFSRLKSASSSAQPRAFPAIARQAPSCGENRGRDAREEPCDTALQAAIVTAIWKGMWPAVGRMSQHWRVPAAWRRCQMHWLARIFGRGAGQLGCRTSGEVRARSWEKNFARAGG